MLSPLFRRVPALLGLTLLVALASPLAASLPDLLSGPAPEVAAPSGPTPGTAEAITANRAEVQKEIARARADLGKLAEGKHDDTALRLTQEIGLLARLDGLHAEQLRTLQHTADLTREAAELAERTKNPSPPEVRFKPPHSLAVFDQLYAERDYLERAEMLLKTDLENASTALDDARDELEDRERLRRTAKQSATTPDNRAPALATLRFAELESRIARETVLLRESALATLKLQQSLLAPKLALLRPDFQWLHAHLDLTTEDLAATNAQREKRLAVIDAALASTGEEAERVARLVVQTERRAAAAAEAGKPTDEELESRRADRQTLNLQLGTLAAQRARQDALVEVRELRRRALAGQGSSSELKTWAAANQEALERLPQTRRPQSTALRQSRRELQDLRARLADPADPARDQAWVADRARHLVAWIEINERELAGLAELATARARLKEELGLRVFTFSLPDTLASIGARLRAAWDYEVFSVSDQPIRVKTILGVAILLLVGHWLSRRASDLIGRAVFRRLGMNTGHRAAWQTLSFYALFFVVLITAVNLFHLSLTQFSVLSGALAVGIGFGSQTLISNFISGIILLLERPVNQGDVIEIDGQMMTVERLGPRSTIVRSFDNAQIVVPNSRLLEENVTNWTLSDDIVRTRINVGVAYGSPTREVERLLGEVLLGMEEVKREPAPVVVFMDFGESALNFQASFWGELQGRKEVESELRHRIAESFATAGIVMAFPQRDVHLATTSPLRVELTNAAAPAKE